MTDTPNNLETLGQLVDTLSIEDMRTHEELAGVYAAAAAIAISSYNGRTNTQPVENITEEHEPLVRRLFQRFDDGNGFIHFPYQRGEATDELGVSLGGIDRYRMVRKRSSDTDKEMTYFTSFTGYAES